MLVEPGTLSGTIKRRKARQNYKVNSQYLQEKA